MKQGSTDDPFAEDDREGEDSEDDEQVEDQWSTADVELADGESARDDPDEERTVSTQRQALPYIHARDGVKEGRTQRPVFLREHVEEGIGDLVDRMETEFGEDIYKTDVTEAAMAVAQENPELVLAKLEEWGYGWT